MNAVNSITTKIFDLVLPAFEWMGVQLALILVSGLFGIVALLIFKQISWQGGIKGVKDKIKGNMIAIRIYQDDLLVVAGSVIRVLLRNIQYLFYNFGPILPLFAPFVLILAQFVVRYAYAPVPVETAGAELLPGQGLMIEVELASERKQEVAGMTLELPDGLRAMSPLVRVASEGRAFQEIVATAPGEYELVFAFADGTRETKALVAGDEPAKLMQPQRVSGFWSAWLFPAEETFAENSPLANVSFAYPARDLGWLPGGELGILLVFFIASMAFGVAILKPLNIQI